ncbi:MAG: hypothetical protein M0Z53_09390 [Thermaerobacter sp.]|nr:hypothetical protein [Thermaerobacter sp.]
MRFALTILPRRLASSPQAIYQSLVRRRQRLEHRRREERLDVAGARAQARSRLTEPIRIAEERDDLEEMAGSEQEALWEELVHEASEPCPAGTDSRPHGQAMPVKSSVENWGGVAWAGLAAWLKVRQARIRHPARRLSKGKERIL